MMFTCVFLRQDSNFIIINYVFEHIFKFQEQIDILFIHKYILWCFLLLHVCFLQFPFFLLSFSLIMIFFTLFYNFDYFNIQSNDSIWTNPNVIMLVLFGSNVYFLKVQMNPNQSNLILVRIQISSKPKPTKPMDTPTIYYENYKHYYLGHEHLRVEISRPGFIKPSLTYLYDINLF